MTNIEKRPAMNKLLKTEVQTKENEIEIFKILGKLHFNTLDHTDDLEYSHPFQPYLDKIFKKFSDYYEHLIQQAVEKITDENKLLRRLLWAHHGCDSRYLYGDDGELQCSNPIHDFPPFTDFKRDSVRLIEWKLGNEFFKNIYPRPK